MGGSLRKGKVWRYLFLAVVLAALFLVRLPVRAAVYKMEINGRLFESGLIQMRSNRLMVPVRTVAEQFGATVTWNAATQEVRLVQNGMTIRMTVGSTTAYADGRVVRMDVAPFIQSDRTVIPVRFFAEAMGAQVGWRQATGTAYIWNSTMPYRVATGDTLYLIAQRYQMTVEQLMGLNSLTSDALTPGQILYVRALAGTAPAGVPAPPAAPRPVTVLGYTVTAYYQDPSGLNAVKAHGGRITDVAMVSHRFTADGHLTGVTQTEVLAAAKSQGEQPWLVVQNVDENWGFSATLGAQLLDSTAAQDAFLADAATLLGQGGYGGLEIDIEGLVPAYRSKLTGFVQRAQGSLGAKGYRLAIAVPAKVWDDPTNGWAGAYDYPALGKLVDRMTLMTYDEHWAGGDPGPIASLPWTSSVLTYAVSVVAPSKLLMGLAGYGYCWPVAGGEWATSIGGAYSEQMATKYGTRWDEGSATPWVFHTEGGTEQRELWFENETSFRMKLIVAAKYGIKGVAIWRLGIEGPSLWAALQ
jgi:spore germination protein YaaH